jgi:transposase-like protein
MGVPEEKREKALAALLSKPTIVSAARQVGVTERTLREWLRDSEFSALYRERRLAFLQETTAGMQRATSDALTALKSVMKSTKAPAIARVMAAVRVLEYAYKGAQFEDLEARIAAIEQRAEEVKAASGASA